MTRNTAGDAAVAMTKVLTFGTRPTHTHSCGHECNSPYCGDMMPCLCENCGGPEAIPQGREPWRGR